MTVGETESTRDIPSLLVMCVLSPDLPMEMFECGPSMHVFECAGSFPTVRTLSLDEQAR